MVAASSAAQRGFLPEPGWVTRVTQAIITIKSYPIRSLASAALARRGGEHGGAIVLSSSTEGLYNGAIHAD